MWKEGNQFCTAAGAGQRVSRSGKSFPAMHPLRGGGVWREGRANYVLVVTGPLVARRRKKKKKKKRKLKCRRFLPVPWTWDFDVLCSKSAAALGIKYSLSNSARGNAVRGKQRRRW